MVRPRLAMTADDRLGELWTKIDAFTSRVNERYPSALACAEGCADCCRRELTVTTIEAERVASLVMDLPADVRSDLAERAGAGEPCVALSANGACAIYAARPTVCRSHGLPLRFADPENQGSNEDPSRERRALPMLDVCPKNFVGQDLRVIDPSCVMDQHTLSVMLGAIDALFVREGEGEEGARYALRDVIAAACEER